MTPIECYKTYLSIKNHFTKSNYDFFKYNGKTKVSEKTFYSKKERFWFEKMSRQKTDKEIINFFVSNYSSSEDPSNLWIGDIIKDGNNVYLNWLDKRNNIFDIFSIECSRLNKKNFNSYFTSKKNSHPEILKDYLKKEICIETLILLNNIIDFQKDYDKKLNDPVWEMVSFKIKKYSCFLDFNMIKYIKKLKEIVK